MRRLLAALTALCILAWAAPAAAIDIYITAGATWVVPTDWNSLSNTVEVIGAGADGAAGGNGFGGDYAKSSNFALTPGATVNIRVGTRLNGGITWFVSSTTLRAGSLGTLAPIGALSYRGGGSPFGGNGGGGAAGPFGAGASGSGAAGGQGDNGHGGAGGAGSGFAGADGTEWGSYGSGGGGGGGPLARNGGLYGGGGGSNNGSSDGQGAQGIIHISYQPYRRASGGVF